MKTSCNFQYLGKDTSNREVYFERATNRLYQIAKSGSVVPLKSKGIDSRLDIAKAGNFSLMTLDLLSLSSSNKREELYSQEAISYHDRAYNA